MTVLSRGHRIACFSDDGEAATDEDADEELGFRTKLAEWLVILNADSCTLTKEGGFSYMDSVVEKTKARGDMLGIVTRKLSMLKLKGLGQNLTPVK